jgi:hypothetical protein
MGSNEDKLKALFKQAAETTSNDTEKIHEAEILSSNNYPAFSEKDSRTLEEKVLDFTESGLTKWDLIEARMNGDFSERFMKEMEQLSGREFVRTYLKMLEYFRPKVIRIESKPKEEEDTVIRVQVFNTYEETTAKEEDEYESED